MKTSALLRLTAPLGTAKLSVCFHCGVCLDEVDRNARYIGCCVNGDIVRRMIIGFGVYSYAFRRRV